MSAHLGRAEIARMARQGVAPLPHEAGFALFDHALSEGLTALVPARLDLSSLARESSSPSAVPALFRSLVERAPRQAASSTRVPESNLCARLSALPESERRGAIANAVREEIASVLGLTPAEVGADSPLRSLGLDSLMAVELKNRLSRRFETALPATLAFDYPSLSALAGMLGDKLKLDRAPTWSDADVRRKLERVSIAALRASGVLERLMREDDEAPARDSYVAPRPDLNIDDIEGDALLDEMERMLEASRGG
jgi:type I polyketide synthase PikAII